jgi:hypothetical protein
MLTYQRENSPPIPSSAASANVPAGTCRASALRQPLVALVRRGVMQRTPTMRHTRTGLSHFVFPDCESSPRCATNLVFYRCMRMSPLGPARRRGVFYARCVQPVLRRAFDTEPKPQ